MSVFRRLGETRTGYRNWTLDITIHYCDKERGYTSYPEYSVKVSAKPNGHPQTAGFDHRESGRFKREYELVGDPSWLDRLLGDTEKEFVGTNAEDIVLEALQQAVSRIDDIEEDIDGPTNQPDTLPHGNVLPVSDWADVLESGDETESSEEVKARVE